MGAGLIPSAFNPPGRTVLFCDFDGTMTTADMIISIWRRFAPPGWEEQVEAMQARRKTLRQGVAEVFAAIPSSKAGDIIEFAREVVRFRPGLQECITYCRERGVDFVVVSGALDFFLPQLLEGFNGLSGVRMIPADLSGPAIRIQPPYPCPDCSLCKAAVMQEYPGAYRILVGDGVTDLHGAREAHFVFARGRLRELLSAEGIPYREFEDFHDVRGVLQELAPWTTGGASRA